MSAKRKEYVDTRRHWEILGWKSGACNVVARAQSLAEAFDDYEAACEAGAHDTIRIRLRVIVETETDVTPGGYAVVVHWRSEFEDQPHAQQFKTKAAALAFAQEGNDLAVMSKVFCVENDTAQVIYSWPS